MVDFFKRWSSVATYPASNGINFWLRTAFKEAIEVGMRHGYKQGAEEFRNWLLETLPEELEARDMSNGFNIDLTHERHKFWNKCRNEIHDLIFYHSV